MGDLLRCAVFDGRDEYFAAHDEGDLLAVGRGCGGRRAAVVAEHGGDVLIVTGERDCQFGRTATGLLRINLAVIGIAQRAVGGDGEEADGVGLERRQGTRFRGAVEREGVDVECAPVTFAQAVDLVAVG